MILARDELKLLNKITKENPYFKYFTKEKKGNPEYRTVMFSFVALVTQTPSSEGYYYYNGELSKNPIPPQSPLIKLPCTHIW